jgi:hypothetical protein
MKKTYDFKQFEVIVTFESVTANNILKSAWTSCHVDVELETSVSEISSASVIKVSVCDVQILS